MLFCGVTVYCKSSSNILPISSSNILPIKGMKVWHPKQINILLNFNYEYFMEVKIPDIVVRGSRCGRVALTPPCLRY